MARPAWTRCHNLSGSRSWVLPAACSDSASSASRESILRLAEQPLPLLLRLDFGLDGCCKLILLRFRQGRRRLERIFQGLRHRSSPVAYSRNTTPTRAPYPADAV